MDMSMYMYTHTDTNTTIDMDMDKEIDVDMDVHVEISRMMTRVSIFRQKIYFAKHETRQNETTISSA